MTLDGIVAGLGSATLASVNAAAINPNKSFVNREAVTNQDGAVAVTSTRRIGTLVLGDFPAGITAPAGWSGYLLSMTGYQDTATSQAGSTTTAGPTAQATSGTLSVWNGSGYTPFSVNSASLNSLAASATQTRTIAGHVIVVTISVGSGGLQATSKGTTQTCSPSGTLTQCTNENSSVNPPSATVHYVITVDGTVAVDLHIALNMGTMLTRSVYAPAPVAG